jgi:hypothetical protein
MLLILTSGLAPHFADTASGANYYVATDGNDTNSGSQNSPFATLNTGRRYLNLVTRCMSEAALTTKA